MTRQEWEHKVRELELDHIAAGGFISRREAEMIVEEVYGPKPFNGNAKASASNASKQD